MLSVDFIAEKLHILLFSEIPVAWSHRKSILLFVYWCFDVKSTYRRKRLSDYWRGSRGLVPQSPPSLPLMERWVKDQGGGGGGVDFWRGRRSLEAPSPPSINIQREIFLRNKLADPHFYPPKLGHKSLSSIRLQNWNLWTLCFIPGKEAETSWAIWTYVGKPNRHRTIDHLLPQSGQHNNTRFTHVLLEGCLFIYQNRVQPKRI